MIVGIWSANMAGKLPESHATPMAARKPISMATPPSRGIGLSWTARSVGMASTPRRRDAHFTTGVIKNVTTKAMTNVTT